MPDVAPTESSADGAMVTAEAEAEAAVEAEAAAGVGVAGSSFHSLFK